MADNFTAKDAGSSTITIRAKDNAGVLSPGRYTDDGYDVTQGAVADAVVAAGAAGTVSAKLRRISQGLEDLKTLLVLAAGTNLIGKVGIDQTTPGTTNLVAVTGLPAAAALADAAGNPTTPLLGVCLLAFNGATWDRLITPNVRKDLSAVAIGSITTVWTPAGGKKFRLTGGTISVSAAASVLFEDNSGGNTVFRTPKLAADTPYNFDLGNGVLSATANNVLKATSSAAANVTGTIWGVEV